MLKLFPLVQIYVTRAIIFWSLFVQILLKKFSPIILVVLSFQCQSSFSMDTGDSFWDETIGNCQDWLDRITNDPLPKCAIFYIVNYSDYPCELEFNNVGEKKEKILIEEPVYCYTAISLINLRREIKKKDGYEWKTTLNELTYKISKIMYENPPMPAIRIAGTFFLPTKLVRSNIFLVVNDGVFCFFADFEVGKFLWSSSLGLPKDIRLYILSYFLFLNMTDDYEREYEYKLQLYD